MVERAAIVVGGGIAGLAAAASLSRAQWRVTVLERAVAFGEVGAGLAVTRNGMAALRAVGADESVRAAGHPLFVAGTQDERGRWLMRLPDAGADPEATTRAYGVHRQRLHDALLRAAGDADLVPGAEVVSVEAGEPDGAPATVTFRTGAGERTLDADLVVGADGIHSVVRARLWPGARLAYSGYTSWRPSWTVCTRSTTGSSSPGARAPSSACCASMRRRCTGTAISGTPPACPSTTSPPRRAPMSATGRRGRVPSWQRPATTGSCATTCTTCRTVSRRTSGDGSSPRRSAMTARFGAHVGGGWRQSARRAVMRLVPGGVAARAGGEILR